MKKPPLLAPQERYTWIWLLILGLLVGGFKLLYRPQLPLRYSVAIPSLAQSNPEIDYFLVLKVPEVQGDELQDDLARERLEGWLNQLLSAGFKPMLLSDIRWRLENKKGLPERAFTLVFDPGFRRSSEVFAPVLAKYHCPAVWIVDRSQINKARRKHLSFHAVRQLRNAYLYDVGSYARRGGPFDLVGSGHPKNLGRREGVRGLRFNPDRNRRAINRGSGLTSFNRLKLHSQWTGKQLVERLLLEQPIEKPVALSVRYVEAQPWGISLEDKAAPFEIRTQPASRSEKVSWASTITRGEGELELNIGSISGEFWVLLQSEGYEGSGVAVGFLKNLLVVERYSNGSKSRLAYLPTPVLKQEGFSSTIKLSHGQLKVKVNRYDLLEVDLPHGSTSAQGILEMMVYDRARGAARAEIASAQWIPHHEPTR